MTNQDPRQPDRFEATPPSGPANPNPTQWATPNTLSSQVSPASAAVAVTREGFLTMSFVWMTLGLLLSAGTAAARPQPAQPPGHASPSGIWRS